MRREPEEAAAEQQREARLRDAAGLAVGETVILLTPSLHPY